jgi:DNA-directed RNA polymerase subunit RPC12/RpoP
MSSILFKCPECKKIFEFDLIGEYELVSCPICGNDFQTIKKEGTLRLEPFECNQQMPKDQEELIIFQEITN